MEYINDKKISDTEYQRDGAVEGGDVNTFRDDRPEYSRGGRGRRGGAHRSDNWRSDPSGGGGGNRDDNEEYRGGRGGYRGGRGGRGGGRGRGSYNAWTNRETRDEDNASPAAADAAGDRASFLSRLVVSPLLRTRDVRRCLSPGVARMTVATAAADVVVTALAAATTTVASAAVVVARGGRRDFRSFRNEDDVMEESGGAQGNAWASSPAPTEARTAPQESAPAPATTAGAVALRSAVPDPAKAGEDVTSPAPQQTQSGIRRVTRASHLRRNCHDEAKVMELFEHRHRQTGISLENYDSIPVEMVPRDVKPVEDFADLLVEPALAANIERCGYKKPTPVQRYGIPVALSGSDLMACAQTGSGKTAAFLIPVVQYMLVHGVSPARQRKSYPIALVLAPTRELAVQIFDEVRKLTFNTDIFYDVVYGGTRYPQRFEQDILVACPGRLRDMFNEEYLSFSAIKFLILDEADRMLEMGFEEQIEELVASRYTDMPTVDERQTFMFSATFPQRILNLAKRYLRRKYYLLTVGRVGSTTKNITQTIEHVPDNEKMDRLLQIIYGHEMSDMVLIFVETKKMAEDVNRRLHREGISSTTIHGDRRQQDREAALEDFKQKVTPILVATDVASRGLDIPDVAHVVQFDLPQEMDDYTHRIGRTGRAGNKGIATAFYNRNNRRLALDLHKYFSEHGQEIPKWFQQEAELVEGEALLRPSAPSGGGRRGGGVDDGGF
ncbi:DEAD/DEAH box helicase family protein [Leishmania donovani]|uniref:Probable eukaryotic initiation factor 4A n=2 Tax=Leishmania donovani TaxID=5661 RepID=A0A504XKH9_LEIDO|nr:DEAD/DEAH box helicase family protein [Leishmania donovani]